MPMQDPDAALLAVFRHVALQNPAKTLKEGRPIFDDMEVCEIRFPGRRDWQAFPATAVSHWATDPHTGGQMQVTYAERFARQYQQFKSHAAQTKSGTPLSHAPFLTEGRRAELRAQNIFTVEALASIDGQDLKNLGQGGRDLKNAAEDYILEAKMSAPNLQMQAELEALKARNQVLEDDMAAVKKAQASAAAEFDDMSEDALRDYIKSHSGHAPQGQLTRKTLLRMALDARPNKAA
jgi:hypothetical protein